MRHIELVRLPDEEYLLEETKYVDSHDLINIYDKMDMNGNLLLAGPKGIGKSLSLAHWAAKNKIPMINVECSEDIRRSQLVGTFVLQGDQSPFVLGPIPTAYEVANSYGQCILNLEEINGLTPQMQKLLNSSTDFRMSFEVTEANRVFRLEKGAKLWVVGSMNDSGYGGVFSLNEDLKSRFRILDLGYPSVQTIETILESQNISIERTHWNALRTLYAELKTKSLSYRLSPRDICQIAEDIRRFDVEQAFRFCMGKMEEDDKDTFKKRVESTFGIVL